MNRSWLMQEQNANNIVRILQSWRLWLVGALIGSIGGGIFYQFSPPPFQAQSVVIIDHNLEEAWEFPFDKILFYFLARESNKLQAIAWSDEVIDPIIEEYPEFTKSNLKNSILNLDTSHDGLWVFYAKSNHKEEAIELVNIWTTSFVDVIISKISTSFEIEMRRSKLTKFIADKPEITLLEIEREIRLVVPLIEEFTGVSPYIELNLTQGGHINENVDIAISSYYLLGSFIGAILLFIITIFRNKPVYLHE